MAAVILVLLPLTVPKLFGYQIYGILTDSMEPTYPAGCVVYVRPTDSSKIQVGDPITFKMGTDTELVTTHRVVEIDSRKRQFITKGDANGSADSSPVSFDRLIGKVVFQIPLFCLSVYQNRHCGLRISICGGSVSVGNSR